MAILGASLGLWQSLVPTLQAPVSPLLSITRARLHGRSHGSGTHLMLKLTLSQDRGQHTVATSLEASYTRSVVGMEDLDLTISTRWMSIR